MNSDGVHVAKYLGFRKVFREAVDISIFFLLAIVLSVFDLCILLNNTQNGS